jgi:hypothetical protein
LIVVGEPVPTGAGAVFFDRPRADVDYVLIGRRACGVQRALERYGVRIADAAVEIYAVVERARTGSRQAGERERRREGERKTTQRESAFPGDAPA